MFGINGAEFVVILAVAALVVGPEGIIRALRSFRRLVDSLKSWSAALRESAQRDLPTTASPVLDLSSFDPGDLDPRDMVRRAVHEEMTAWMHATSTPTTPVPPTTGHHPQEDQ